MIYRRTERFRKSFKRLPRHIQEKAVKAFSLLQADLGHLSLGVKKMLRYFTLEYWMDDGWYIGRLREVSGVFSQAETLEELEANIIDAYRLMMEDSDAFPTTGRQTKELAIQL